MSDKSILIDLSTSYQFRHWRPMGILRVEHEVWRAFAARFGARAVPAIYDEARGGFYRIPQAIFEEVIFRNGCQPEAPARALTAPRRWRSWARIGRFLWRARRRMRAVGQGGQYDEAETRVRRESAVAEELLRLSGEEYALMRRGFVALERVAPGIAPRIRALDALNHRAHYGLVHTVHDQICADRNRIAPEEVGEYVSAGGFWGDARYRAAYEMRTAHGWRLSYYIHDLIPILWGHVAEPTTRKTFPPALHWMLWGVDRVWTNSEVTRRDLLAHAARCGYPELEPEKVRVVTLGADALRETAPATDLAGLFAQRDLEPGGYVLMVGTQEPRKNHDFAYRLWRELAARRAGDIMPLVWVGQPGWSIGPLLEMVRADPGLPHGAIRILDDVDDVELEALYAHCRYTIYPSHYEGWGLPVVESLLHGKPCLTSDAPALIEAAEGCAEAIGLFEGERWLARLEALMEDAAAYRAACAQAERFTPHRWADFREALTAGFDAAGDDISTRDPAWAQQRRQPIRYREDAA
ncbi:MULTISPECIES: glycosyltransferase family 4 protein [Thioclava]|uniref:glycosyltransferase family 4 protein n=1 Tax=Thioclava TaxID=285107 RepID=UPI000C47FECE|nr:MULTISPECIES: glycosyltransferase family 1 protein [Thioclava]MAQ39363.1 hypothetical protein [Thioclava sp.]